MDLEYIESLAELVRATTVAELTVRRGERRVTLRRQPGGALAVVAEPQPEGLVSDLTTLPTLLPIPLSAEGALIAVGESPAEPRTEIVKAHRVGYFHRGGSEEGEPLVQVGDWVAAGQQLASIETMRVFDEVDAPLNGHIIGIFVADGAPVEYGQPLFHLQQSDSPDDGLAASEEEVAP